MNTSQFGCYSEYRFAIEAIKNGLHVSFPLLHSSTYDCIVDTPNGLFKVQIKAVGKNNKRQRVNLTTKYIPSYNINEVDYFAVYSEIKDGFYIFKNTPDLKCFELSEKNIKNFNNFALL